MFLSVVLLLGIAINSVLKVAKQIYTDGYNKVYVKPGGRKKCYQDFYSVSPKKVTSINGVRKLFVKTWALYS